MRFSALVKPDIDPVVALLRVTTMFAPNPDLAAWIVVIKDCSPSAVTSSTVNCASTCQLRTSDIAAEIVGRTIAGSVEGLTAVASGDAEAGMASEAPSPPHAPAAMAIKVEMVTLIRSG